MEEASLEGSDRALIQRSERGQCPDQRTMLLVCIMPCILWTRHHSVTLLWLHVVNESNLSGLLLIPGQKVVELA